MVDVVIATVPFVDEDTPLAAPAVLKSSLQLHGISCKALDLNIEIYNKIHHHPHRRLFVNFFWHQLIDERIVNDLVSMLHFYAQEILSHRPSIIGLSLFSKECQTFCAWLCAVLKQKSPETTIVIGGSGINTLENELFKFPDKMKHLKLIDDYIVGDGETSLIEYVKGNKNFHGINELQWKPNDNYNSIPIPDYSDYRFFRYPTTAIPIVDSRGCVQDCEFCDVIVLWKKFQYKKAEIIFEEMKDHIKNYNIYRFQFNSSICNGNLKEFRRLMSLIAEYNDSVELEQQIHWAGHFIVRPASVHTETLWQTMKKTNGFLWVGVESVVERVRVNLGKKFSNADLDHHLEMGRKYQVPMNLLCIAAYHTETTEEYEEAKQWFIDRQEFANDSVMQVQLTIPNVLAGTRLEATVDKDKFNETHPLRVKHARALYNTIKSCGFETRHFF
jgi:radical SAM superfamily enzyme YgiQ (UPF0313 family)